MKTKKAYSLALAAVMASSVLWGCGSSSTDPGTGAAEASDSGTKEAGGGQTLRVTVQAWMMGNMIWRGLQRNLRKRIRV